VPNEVLFIGDKLYFQKLSLKSIVNFKLLSVFFNPFPVSKTKIKGFLSHASQTG
jgi:hypothetical protein